MKSKILNQVSGESVFAVVFDKGDEVVHGLLEFATRYKIGGAQIVGVGAFSDVVLGFFEPTRRHYHEIPIHEQVELLSLVGDITIEDENPKLHAHCVVGRSTGQAYGGHLLTATVWPTLEIVVTESPRYLQRRRDPETGLALIDLAA
jgi:predicted DNA-binding protein with PD1-like motif